MEYPNYQRIKNVGDIIFLKERELTMRFTKELLKDITPEEFTYLKEMFYGALCVKWRSYSENN